MREPTNDHIRYNNIRNFIGECEKFMKVLEEFGKYPMAIKTIRKYFNDITLAYEKRRFESVRTDSSHLLWVLNQYYYGMKNLEGFIDLHNSVFRLEESFYDFGGV